MSLLNQNEKEANIIVAKVMRVTFIIFTFIYLLNVLGIFVVDKKIMTIAYVGAGVILFLPTILVNVLKMEQWYIKYVSVVCAALFVTLLSITLTYHVVAIYVYPIAIASLYFSKRLNIIATTLTVVGVSIGQVLAFFLQTLQDDNFTKFNSVIVFGVIPRALVLVAVAAIFTMLCSRTASMLSNLLGAQEQKEMLERMQKMKENAVNTSETMVDMVTKLANITDVSLKANQKITEQTQGLLEGSNENTIAVEKADQRMQDIAEQLAGLSHMNHTTAKLTDDIGEHSKDNQVRIDDATLNMEQIYTSTNECKEIISRLGEESKEIIGIIQTITSISSQTNILALNASIEAARAGEHGKGFAVVAEEIQKLSEQTKNAVEGIRTIVHEVVRNTEEAVSAMEKNVQYTQSGMDSIQKANDSTTQITNYNKELVQQIHEIDNVAEIIRQKSDEVSESMRRISDNAQQNCNAVEHVTAASQENSAGTESLAGIVEQIEELSKRLNDIIET